MRLFGYDLVVTKAAPPVLSPVPPSPWWASARAWTPVVRESYPGAWQQNVEVRPESALAYFAVFACATLIASDIAKLQLRLVEQDDDGIWHETTNPAYSPVLRQPNRYQTTIKFVERWIISKLITGNTYVLKQRDARGVVTALYVLDPSCVQPLVAPDGSVYYQLTREDLHWVFDEDLREVTVPASELIHDLMVPIFHPLVGVTPLFACAASVIQGQNIQTGASAFFANGSNPGGLLIAPKGINEEQAEAIKTTWESKFQGSNQGRLAVLGGELEYKALTINAVDAQLIDQLKWTADTVCSVYHVPAYMVGIGPPPPYANVEPLLQQYYSQCIQSLLASFEAALDRGLEFNRPTIGVEFNIDDLLWMDTATRTKAGTDAIAGALMAPDEARRKYFGLGPVKGGDSPMAQQQYYSLAALAERDQDKPFAKPTPATPPAAPARIDDEDDEDTRALELVTRYASLEVRLRRYTQRAAA